MSLEWVLVAVLGLGAYLLGSFPTAYLVVRRAKRQDIRELGSHNVGAMNAFQQAGKALGLLVLVTDAGKGVIAVMAPLWLGFPQWTVFLTSGLAVIGHIWPVFLNFRGGKGAAVVLGVSMTFLPLPTLTAAVPTALIIFATRNVVIGAVLGFVMLNTLVIATGQGPAQVAVCMLMTVLVSTTYVVSLRKQLGSAIRRRDWKALFYGSKP